MGNGEPDSHCPYQHSEQLLQELSGLIKDVISIGLRNL